MWSHRCTVGTGRCRSTWRFWLLLKYLNKCWIDCCDICYKHSWSPDDALWSPDLSFSSIISQPQICLRGLCLNTRYSKTPHSVRENLHIKACPRKLPMHGYFSISLSLHSSSTVDWAHSLWGHQCSVWWRWSCLFWLRWPLLIFFVFFQLKVNGGTCVSRNVRAYAVQVMSSVFYSDMLANNRPASWRTFLFVKHSCI